MSKKKLSVELENSFTNDFNTTVILSGNIDPNFLTIEHEATATFGFIQNDIIQFMVNVGSLPGLSIEYTSNTILLQSGSEWVQFPTQNSGTFIFGYAKATASYPDVYIVTITYNGDIGGGIAMVGTVSMIVPK